MHPWLELMFSLKGVYLIGYNLASVAGWGVVLAMSALQIKQCVETQSLEAVYNGSFWNSRIEGTCEIHCLFAPNVP